MKRERKGFTMSDLERMKAGNLAREELQKLATWPNPMLPPLPRYTGPLWRAMERQDPIQDGGNRVAVTASFNGGSGGGGGGSFTPPPGMSLSKGMMFPTSGAFGGPVTVDYDEMVRADGVIVRRDPVTVQTWLPEYEPRPPKPEPPKGRFQNLDFDV